MTTEIRMTDPITGGEKGAKAEDYDQIPVDPLAELARVYTFGAGKYARGNYLRGYAWSLSMSAMLRHIHAFRAGESLDRESSLHHLAHAVFHCFALMEFERRGIGTDDRLFIDPENQREECDECGCGETGYIDGCACDLGRADTGGGFR